MSNKKTTKVQKDKKPEQDESFLKLFPFYRRKCQNFGLQLHPKLKDKFLQVAQTQKLQPMQIWDQLGPLQTRAVMQALADLNFQHLKTIKIWKGKVGDEGVRAICKYISKSNTIEVLDLLDNQITSLGCQFIGKSLFEKNCKVTKLKLDDNLIGSLGLQMLTLGLRQNYHLDKLSLKYCGIDEKGTIFIQQILANIKTNLRSLKLQGNPLGNNGAYQILRAVNKGGQALQKLNLADVKIDILEFKNQIINKKEEQEELNLNSLKQVILKDKYNEQQEQYVINPVTIEEKIMHQLEVILKNNSKIFKYNINFNQLSKDAGAIILSRIQKNRKITEFEVPNSIPYEIRDKIDTILRKRNKKGITRNKSNVKKR